MQHERPAPAPFYPEAAHWLKRPNGKLSSEGKRLSGLVSLRNKHVHGGPPTSDNDAAEPTRLFHAELLALLGGLRWLQGYRPLRVKQQSATRRGPNRGLLQAYVGDREEPELMPAEWGPSSSKMRST